MAIPLRGFILAAGFGTRLLPITRDIPKALVPVQHRVMADFARLMLKDAGIHEIGMNAHHHRQQVMAYAEKHGLICFSEPAILGTGGFLENLDAFLLGGTMVVVNCDAVFLPPGTLVAELLRSHQHLDATATMVLRRKRAGDTATGIEVRDDRVMEIGTGPYMFTGLYAVSPAILPMVKGPDIIPVFKKLSAMGRLGACLYEGDWLDGGTRAGLLHLHRIHTGLDTLIYPGAVVEPGALIQGSVLYPGSRVEAGARVEDAIVYGGCIRSGEHIKECIYT